MPTRAAERPASPTPTTPGSRAPWIGLVATVALIAAAGLVPVAFGWEVRTRVDDLGPFPPLHGFFEAKVGPGTLPAIAIAVVGTLYAVDAAQRLTWRRLLVVAYAVGLAWLLALAFVDGASGIDRVLGNGFEYLTTARETDDVGVLLGEYVDRIPYAAEGNWVTHVAGHPPGALLFFIGLVRIGLGGDFAAGLVVAVIAATTSLGVLVTLKALDAEATARRVAPFLVLTPAAVFMAVSADAMFAAVAAWGLAALALGAVAASRRRAVAWSVLAGLLLGYCVLLSYGLPLLGLLALAVLITARSWLPLPIAGGTALLLVLGFAAAGFAWWEAYPVLTDRYYDGVAGERPLTYWVWGNLAALAYSAGPLLGASLVLLRRHTDRVVLLLAGAAVVIIALADVSGMSRSEVERIWLPFIPWLTVSVALLPDRWIRPGLALQVGFALVVQHLLYTSW